jgi:hypothetical protein
MGFQNASAFMEIISHCSKASIEISSLKSLLKLQAFREYYFVTNDSQKCKPESLSFPVCGRRSVKKTSINLIGLP